MFKSDKADEVVIELSFGTDDAMFAIDENDTLRKWAEDIQDFDVVAEAFEAVLLRWKHEGSEHFEKAMDGAYTLIRQAVANELARQLNEGGAPQ